ncbi:MAG: ATPase, T2SS/T4P/T4SS family [Candidatus Micrarchaeia archaeon]
MFYLGKYLSNLVIKKHKEEQAEKSYELGFFMEQQEGEPVDVTSGSIPRAVLRQKNAYAYSVAYGIKPLTRYETGLAQATKAKLIDVLANGDDEISMAIFEKARGIAFQELSNKLDQQRASFIAYLLAHDTVGFGPFSVLLDDKASIEEIEVNSPGMPIVVHHVNYGMCQTNLRFTSERWFRHFINKMAYRAEKQLDEDFPIVDAQVEDMRIHAQIRPYAQSGAAATIRLGNAKHAGIRFLLDNQTASAEVLAYAWLAVDSGINILVSGAPASGKTTLLNALIAFVPRYLRVVTIEDDINELDNASGLNNMVSLYGSRYGGGVSSKEQVLNALRMRPDRLVVGEIRGSEANDLFAGANLGIPFITTMHSNQGAIEIVKKLLVSPMSVDQKSLTMLDLAFYMRQVDISRRVLASAYEYRWLSRAETESGIELSEENSLKVDEIVKEGRLDTGMLPFSKVIQAYASKKGITKRRALLEFNRRSAFLRKLAGEKSSDFNEAIQEYGELHA